MVISGDCLSCPHNRYEVEPFASWLADRKKNAQLKISPVQSNVEKGLRYMQINAVGSSSLNIQLGKCEQSGCSEFVQSNTCSRFLKIDLGALEWLKRGPVGPSVIIGEM